VSDWTINLALADAGGPPVFLQIAHALAEAVRAGRLRPGQRLPGSRRMADDLGVHRNTVLAAYAELSAEGWIDATHGRGTFVSADIPDERPRRLAGAARRSATPRRTSFPLPAGGAAGARRASHPAGALVLAGGVPDLRLVARAPLWRAYRRVLSRGPVELLGYGDPRGHARLRAALARMLAATRGLAAVADDLVVTRGSQMGLHLVARALVAPGDLVAVEALGYRPAWETLRAAGARLVAIPVDAGGIDVDRLRLLAARRRLRAVYVTPHHQYPTTVPMSPARRLALLALAAERGFAVIEDDYDNEFHYQGRPILPLASADTAGAVIYVGTLSKVLAPALRIGYLVAPPPLAERFAALRSITDGQGDSITEAAVADLIEEGELQRHVRRVRGIYRARRDAIAVALRRELGGDLAFALPPGGMALWAGARRGIDVDAWAARAAAGGVIVSTGREFAMDGRPRPFFRLGFAQRSEPEIAEAVRRLAAARRR
jgi:GntR family transcriptional regulator/MocR family aminotransferase